MSLGEWVIGVLSGLLPGLAPDAPPVFNGYLEADYVYVAPLSPGRIVSIAAEEGGRVQPGAVLVRLEDQAQKAALRAAEAAVAQARANLDNLATGGRADEIAVIAASLHRAEADKALAEANFARSTRLAGQGQVSAARLDQDRTALEAARAQVEQLQAQLAVVRLPAREAQRLAAEAGLKMVEAQAEAARIALADRVLRAPVGGLVERRFYEAGEVAGAGAPILAILVPGEIRVIFYVPEAERAGMRLGDVLKMGCDGCGEGMEARVVEMASAPQYTPPILYSRDERGRLVYRAEAELRGAEGLLPGQPVTLWR